MHSLAVNQTRLKAKKSENILKLYNNKTENSRILESYNLIIKKILVQKYQ